MNLIPSAARSALLLLLLASLAACRTPFRYENPQAYGATLRATMASQVVAPPVRPAAAPDGADGAAAVAAYANYQRSYVTPTSQSDSPTFGKK